MLRDSWHDWSETASDDVSQLELHDLIDSAIYDHGLDRTLNSKQVDDTTPATYKENCAPPCWGGTLKHDVGQCEPGFVARSGHFKNKICANCRKHGFPLMASRIATIPSDLPSLANSVEVGLWNVYADGAKYRVISALTSLNIARTRTMHPCSSPCASLDSVLVLTMPSCPPRRSHGKVRWSSLGHLRRRRP